MVLKDRDAVVPFPLSSEKSAPMIGSTPRQSEKIVMNASAGDDIGPFRPQLGRAAPHQVSFSIDGQCTPILRLHRGDPTSSAAKRANLANRKQPLRILVGKWLEGTA